MSCPLARIIVLACTLFLGAAESDACEGTWVGNAAPPPRFVQVKKEIRVPMRDGVHLALDLYLPAPDDEASVSKLPTLLARTPYNKNGMVAEARWFAAHGYAVVINDVRGRYASEGSWRMLLDDPHDGYDLVRWIGEQPWCNGRIGTFGTSYVGGTQHALACARPPHLTCMIPVDSVSNTGVDRKSTRLNSSHTVISYAVFCL